MVKVRKQEQILQPQSKPKIGKKENNTHEKKQKNTTTPTSTQERGILDYRITITIAVKN